MDCQQFEHLLDDYLDGDLSGTLKREFEAHLVACENCSHLYAAMEVFGQIVAEPSIGEPKLRADFTDSVMAVIADRQSRKLRFSKILSACAVAASVALILTGMVFFTDSSSTQLAAVGSSPSQNLVSGNMNKVDPAFMSAAQLAGAANIASSASLAADVSGDQQQKASEELNQWLAVKLERAGTSLWEITQLRSLAWSQMRQGLMKSIAAPANPAYNYLPANTVVSPSAELKNAGELDHVDSVNEYVPTLGDDTFLEAGIELL